VGAQPILIAQVSDLHVRPKGELAYGKVDTAAAAALCVAKLNRLAPRPQLVVVTGDLVDTAMPEEYAHLRELLAPLEIPLALIPGNHDGRAPMRAAFPEQPYANGSSALNLGLELAGLDVLLLDSSVAGKPHGTLEPATLSWLDASLAASHHRPALVFLHHPPFVTGISHMDEMNLRNPDAFAEVLRRHPRVRLVAAGHVHRPTMTVFAGIPTTICPAPSHAVALDLTGGAPSFTRESLGLHLHAWFPGERYGEVVTHFVSLDTPDGQHPFTGDQA
jgi:3',5'-cyclic AMP phosphodiesterase CpdA